MTVLPDFRLSRNGPLGTLFADHGHAGFRAAAEHLRHLPYGRTSRPHDYTLVLAEGRGTCSTKHALLAAVATEHGAQVDLCLGIYAMNALNTLGVGAVLARHGLPYLLEAHCYLTYGSARVDVTRTQADSLAPSEFVLEMRIRPEDIGERKRKLHQRVLGDWARQHGHDFQRVWAAREECIAALSVRGY